MNSNKASVIYKVGVRTAISLTHRNPVFKMKNTETEGQMNERKEERN